MKRETMSTQSMLMAISSVSSFVKQLLGKGKDYDEFLKYWLNKYDDLDEDAPFPTIKDLMAETSLSYSKLKRFIKTIYLELIQNYNGEIDYRFKEKEYFFYMRYFDKSAYFEVTELSHLPRVGESVRIAHFREYVGTDMFYVDSIEHEFTDGKQVVNIRLLDGSYNLFWHMRKDEAKTKNEIPWVDFHKLMEFQLKEKLGLSRF